AKGELIYRGYDIRQLADKASFEEVVYLLWNGELPTATQLDDFNAGLAASFSVLEAVYEMLAAAPRNAAPMHLLRTAVSMLGAFDEDADEVDMPNVRRIGTRLLSQFPTVVAAIQRIRDGLDPI